MAKSNKGKNGGRPTKLSEKTLEKIRILARHGLNDKSIATCVGINESTLHRWKHKHPEFCKSLKNWKVHADDDVESSLFHRATGYSCPEEKVFIANGKPLSVPTTKHFPPDPASMIFWLKNRQPKRWKDKQEIEANVDGSLKIEIVKFGEGKNPK